MLKRRRTPEELERLYWATLAKDYKRNQEEVLKQQKVWVEPVKIPNGPNHTRSSFAFARANPKTSTDRVRPLDLTSKSVDFLPGGQSGCFDVSPQLRTKNVMEYWIILKRGKREMLIARGFTKCCNIGTGCERERCAKCWALRQKEKPGWKYLVREVITDKNPKVVDPFGVDNKGRRAKGKNMDPDSQARMRLTSSLFHYKKDAANWR